MCIRPYPAAAQPDTFNTELGEEITLRPMMAADKEALHDFFRRIPGADRFYLKEDVVSLAVLTQWIHSLDYARTLPILALADGKIVADGTLHFCRAGARRHIGEIRILVDPEYRRRGIGRRLMKKLVEVATEEGLEKLMFEIVSEAEEPAKHTARTLGFLPIAVLPDHVRDIWGGTHDLVTMEKRLDETESEDPYTLWEF